jgi:hypothetical protein
MKWYKMNKIVVCNSKTLQLILILNKISDKKFNIKRTQGFTRIQFYQHMFRKKMLNNPVHLPTFYLSTG